MKKKMPREGKKYKKIDIKKKLKEVLTFKNICKIVSSVLFIWIGAKFFILGMKLIAPLLLLLIAIIRLPEAAFTGKFIFLLIMFTWVMYILLRTLFRMAFKYFFEKLF